MVPDDQTSHYGSATRHNATQYILADFETFHQLQDVVPEWLMGMTRKIRSYE
jgi:hypothetical protein